VAHFDTCCGDLAATGLSRRGLLLGAGAVALTLRPLLVRAAPGDYQAMILGCIDPRLQTPVRNYAVAHGLDGLYSQFIFAGAAIGAVAPAFASWHDTFWDNLATSVKLHGIKSVIAIDHRDCGAAKIAYGDASIATAEVETETHKKAMTEFRSEVAKRQPTLKIETMLMALDGSVITFG
jgi:carbonic anhydrase